MRSALIFVLTHHKTDQMNLEAWSPLNSKEGLMSIIPTRSRSDGPGFELKFSVTQGMNSKPAHQIFCNTKTEIICCDLNFPKIVVLEFTSNKEHFFSPKGPLFQHKYGPSHYLFYYPLVSTSLEWICIWNLSVYKKNIFMGLEMLSHL